jgi:hypothetical protein
MKSPHHPASIVARQGKNALTAFFEQEATRAGAPRPTELAQS